MREILIKSGVKASDSLVSALYDTFELYKINTRLKQVHFLGQCAHESLNFTRFEENMNYSAKRLLEIFPKYFDANSIYAYERNPKLIGSRVYANRMGNGDEKSGDGYNYRGRGAIQCTGKDLYYKLSKEFNIDFINNPDLLATYPYNILSAGYYWYHNNLNVLAELDDIKAITKKINGGYIGLNERLNLVNKFKFNYNGVN